MPALVLPSHSLLAAPQEPFELNWESPAAESLAGWWPMMAQGGPLILDLSGTGRHGQGSGITWTDSPLGNAVRFDAISDWVDFGDASWLPTSEITIVLWQRKTDTTLRASSAFGVHDISDATRCGAHLPYSDGVIYFDFGGQTSGTTRVTASGLSFDTDWHCWVFTIGSRGMEIWRDGAIVGSNTATPTRSSSTNSFTLGRHDGVLDCDLVEIGDFRVYSKQLPKASIEELSGISCGAGLRRSFFDQVVFISAAGPVIESGQGAIAGRSSWIVTPQVARLIGGVVSGRSNLTDAVIRARSADGRISAVSRIAEADTRIRSVATSIVGAARAALGSLRARQADAMVGGRSRIIGSPLRVRAVEAVISGRSFMRGAAQAVYSVWGRLQGYARIIAESLSLLSPLRIDDRTFAASWEDDRTFAASWEDDQAFALESITVTKTGVKIADVPIGGDVRIKRTYNQLPTGVTITKAWCTVKKKDTDPDAQAVFQKVIAASAGPTGHITDASTVNGDLAMYFDLSKTDTALAKAGFDYEHDVQVLTTTGEIHTMEKGAPIFINRVTKAQS